MGGVSGLGQQGPALPGHRRGARRHRAGHLDGVRRRRGTALAAQRAHSARGHLVARQEVSIDIEAGGGPRRRGPRSRGARVTVEREAAGGSRMRNATVVGAGPNGLAAAITLAKAGTQGTVLEAADDIGGGTRSSEAIIPGLLHDHCSAIHPMAVGSQFLNELGLDRYGLSWRLPEIDCVHPLDGGSAGVLYRSVEATAAGLGVDGRRWRALFGKTSANFDALAEDIMG